MQGKAEALGARSWDDVRLFLALCRARTVTEAGRRLGVDGSTVSRRLAGLEAALEATLFSRGREGIAPTAAAEELLPVAEEIEAAVLRFARAAEGMERTVAGRLRVACPPDVAEVVVAPLLRGLLRKHPALRVELDPSEAVADLARHEADLALRTVRPVRGDLVVTRLTTVRWEIVGAPELTRRLGVVEGWSEVPWIGWGERLAGVAPARWLARHARGVEPVVRSDSLRLQLALAQAGAGAALVPAPSARHYGLAPLRTAAGLREAVGELPEDELYLVTHRALREVPRVAALWEALVAWARGAPARAP
jgi:DNA-binding transcriptional LysR family regulator